jgi:hypothetical protein
MGYDLKLGFWLSVIPTIVAPLKYYLTSGCGGDSHAETDRKDLGVFSPLMAVVADGSSGGGGLSKRLIRIPSYPQSEKLKTTSKNIVNMKIPAPLLKRL